VRLKKTIHQKRLNYKHTRKYKDSVLDFPNQKN
jgi:hypothetical protein